MITASTVCLWLSCGAAVVIAALMFWSFLADHLQGAQRSAATHFAICILLGLLAPIIPAVMLCRRFRRELQQEADSQQPGSGPVAAQRQPDSGAVAPQQQPDP